MDIFNLGKFIKVIKEKLNNCIKTSNEFVDSHKQVVKASGVAAGMILCTILIVTFFTPGYEVYMDGVKIAVVTDKEDFKDGFDAATDKIKKIAGVDFITLDVPRYVFTIAFKAGITGHEKIIQNIMLRSDDISSVSVITVDGVDIANAENEKVAQGLLDKVIAAYSGDNKRILNTVKISGRFVAVKELTDEETAVDMLKDVLNVCAEKTSVYEGAMLYGRVENPTEDLFVNEEQVSLKGENGVMEVKAKVTEVNGMATATEIISTKILKKPVDEIVMVGTTAIPSIGTGVMSQPYYGIVTSRFGARWGRRHNGTDIGGSLGDPITAADTGIVITAEYQENGYGNIIIIDHQNGIHTWYAHLDKIDVLEGETVQKGDKIGELGNTGNSTGPHLHFEVRKNGTPVNPSEYLAEME